MKASDRIVVVYGGAQAEYLADAFAMLGVGLSLYVGDSTVPRSTNLVRAINLASREVDTIVPQLCESEYHLSVITETPLSEGPSEIVAKYADHIEEFRHFSGEALWHWPDDAQVSKTEILNLWNEQIQDFQTVADTYNLICNLKDEVCLYYAPGNPGPHILASLFGELYGRLDFPEDPENRARFALANGEIWKNKGLSHISYHPLSESVISALEFRWAKHDWYRYWQLGVQSSHLGDLNRCRDELELALSSPGCDQHVQYTLGLAYAGLGDDARAKLAFQAAMQAYPANETYAEAWLNSLNLPEDGLATLRGRLKVRFRLDMQA